MLNMEDILYQTKSANGSIIFIKQFIVSNGTAWTQPTYSQYMYSEELNQKDIDLIMNARCHVNHLSSGNLNINLSNFSYDFKKISFLLDLEHPFKLVNNDNQ